MTPTAPRTEHDGTALLDAVHSALTRYVAMPSDHATDAAVLWIAATHAQPAWAHAPRLIIRAPQRASGKTRLLATVEALSHDPVAPHASAAALTLGLSDDPPVLLFDDADTTVGANTCGGDQMRALVAAGYHRDRAALRYDFSTHTPVRRNTFAMAALASTGPLPDTIEDRAVVIPMRRRTGGEPIAPFRAYRDWHPLRHLADQLSAWLGADLIALARSRPHPAVRGRAAQVWAPLVAVADHAGGDWPKRAQDAATALTNQAADHDADHEVNHRADRVDHCAG